MQALFFIFIIIVKDAAGCGVPSRERKGQQGEGKGVGGRRTSEVAQSGVCVVISLDFFLGC